MGSESDFELRLNAGEAKPSSSSNGKLWWPLVPSPTAITSSSGVANCLRNASDSRRTFLGRLPFLAMEATTGSLSGTGDCGTKDNGELAKRTDARFLGVLLLLGDALALMGDALLVDALACAVIISGSVVGGASPFPSLRMRESLFRLGVFLIVVAISAERAGGTRVP